MKYKDIYPNVLKQTAAGYHEPYKDVTIEVEPHIWFSDRYYSCSICKIVTPFVSDTYGCESHVCSTECMQQMMLDQEVVRESTCQQSSAPAGPSIQNQTMGDTSTSTTIKSTVPATAGADLVVNMPGPHLQE